MFTPLPSTATDRVDSGLLMTLTVTKRTDETVCPSRTVSLTTIAGKVNVTRLANILLGGGGWRKKSA